MEKKKLGSHKNRLQQKKVRENLLRLNTKASVPAQKKEPQTILIDWSGKWQALINFF